MPLTLQSRDPTDDHTAFDVLLDGAKIGSLTWTKLVHGPLGPTDHQWRWHIGLGFTSDGEKAGLAATREEAFAALNAAFRVKDSGLTMLKTDPFMRSLRSDARFAQILSKLNLS